jgi:hypothetical protein
MRNSIDIACAWYNSPKVTNRCMEGSEATRYGESLSTVIAA